MNVAIPLFDKFTALDAIGPYEVLCRLPGASVHFGAAEPGVKRTGRMVGWLRKAHARSKWTTSVCTGSLLLAAAGILHGRSRYSVLRTP
jgi:putative intracellular protease/amidase